MRHSVRLVLAFGALLVGATSASASIIGRPIRPLEMVATPPEAVTSAAGGPAVAVVAVVKSKVVGYEDGGPCGGLSGGYSSGSDPTQPASQRSSEENSTRDLMLTIAPPVAGVVIVLAGVWAWRRYG
jgi:hypothetical protein